MKVLRTLSRGLGELVAERHRAVFAAAMVFAASLCLLLAMAARGNVERFSDHVGQGFVVVAYLDDSVDDTSAAVLAGRLADSNAVASARVVPREQALDGLRREFADEPALFDDVDSGLLSTSIELELAGSVTDAALAVPVLRRLQGARGVADIEVTEHEIERMAAFVGDSRQLAGGFFLVVALFFVVAVVGSARLFRGQRSRALGLLLGSSTLRQRIPEISATVMLATLMATAAAFVLWLSFPWWGDSLHGIAQGLALAEDVEPVFPAGSQLAFVVASAGGLALLGSLLPRRRQRERCL